jgi:hypothetical protein
MRVYGDRNQVIDSETSSDKALSLAMTLYIKDLEKKLDLEAGEEAEDGGGEDPVVLSWADFLGVVKQMRIAQTRYFKTRDREDLVKSKTLERVADKAVAAIKAARAGNVSLATYDGELKVSVSAGETLAFDERLQIAREIIGRCLDKWSDGARLEIRLLVNDAFRVDKKGEVSTTRILGLRRLEIDDPDWKRAMAAVTEGAQVSGGKRYLRFYKRNKEGRYEKVPLGVTAL